jgi:hypothetical protein
MPPAVRLERGRIVAVDVAPGIVDRLMELYCDWREECLEVRAAYKHFTAASPAERSLAFAVYEAALDREEAACEAYAMQIRLVT